MIMERTRTIRKAGTVLSLLLFAAVAASAQNFSASWALSTADGIVSGLRDIAFHLVAGILALIAVVLLAWQGAKYLKGDPQCKDSLLAFGAGLIIIVIFMEVIKAVF